MVTSSAVKEMKTNQKAGEWMRSPLSERAAEMTKGTRRVDSKDGKLQLQRLLPSWQGGHLCFNRQPQRPLGGFWMSLRKAIPWPRPSLSQAELGEVLACLTWTRVLRKCSLHWPRLFSLLQQGDDLGLGDLIPCAWAKNTDMWRFICFPYLFFPGFSLGQKKWDPSHLMLCKH